MRITVIGAGAFGSALGQVLEENGHEVRYYDPVLKVELAETLEGAEALVLATPGSVTEAMLPKLPRDLPLVVATKGLMTDVMFGDFADWMVISGPGFAKDIKAHQLTKLTATNPRIVEWFGNDYLSFDRTEDRKGVLMCGSLKNAYAIQAGLLNLKPGTEAHEQFLTEVGGEMRALLSANEAKAETVGLECGVGDLRITCAEPSRNYEYGRRLRWEPEAKPEQTTDGLSALKQIRRGVIKVPAEAARLRELLVLSRTWPKMGQR